MIVHTMTTMNGTQGYSENAKQLADQYESVTFADIYRDMLHLLPTGTIRAADIGAGSGRDAAALARMGHHVVAVEPTEALRREGQQRHPLPNLEWLDDGLPFLPLLRARQEQFDLILLTAVWMHLDEVERAEAMVNLASLLTPGGTVMMTLRHGPVPQGRRMFDVSAEETFKLAAEHRLSRLYWGQRPDMLGRDDVHWGMVALQRTG